MEKIEYRGEILLIRVQQSNLLLEKRFIGQISVKTTDIRQSVRSYARFGRVQMVENRTRNRSSRVVG